MSKIKELLESLGISNKEITRKWHNFQIQICAEKNERGIDEVCLESNWEFYDAHFMVLP